ncbi:MAG TPA: bacteriohopanetetrol glucosamine biosynthesis glycosyltransferase HpnI [Bryobacteraceae bacterium]|nr:bacteriohopanetetrol glucosamine biosynthesis glycosyltransferase HpnI [Bryobacteraceae bacterium]HOL71552.1 bacteriohopanetetrol glucosamine biosynthesis glycosyltransferase HpnI [Bryobacteraceae bacterium]HOQ46685.1 bacteriohopanetetrol glucosamine biosynthesis glycosyltransferase HpnI [Bryobacteraceae bacterium]HPQ14333.1 bacteriohopanetetrol glucosamine biosynthesis glycosyltransferase HpnI [Bryobacteraceae bacterium]HPU72355.1 bacteriohopanetetrol glucosamine biosynthesis glycosyltransf
MIYLLLILGAAAFVFQLLALAAALWRLRVRDPEPSYFPGVSILKPVRGLDPDFYEFIRSHAEQDYPRFEILFGVSHPDDPAIPEIERLAAEYPHIPIRLIVAPTDAANPKVGVLEELAAAAAYPILVVNDSDIRVPEDYLRRVVSRLEDPCCGVVTCLYRACASGLPGRLEAIGIATDFAPGVLVAPLAGISEFALGSTMAFRAADLKAIGGYGALSDYIADDYQLGRRISELGKRVMLSRCVVETSLPGRTWGDVWRHQLRWARTIRVSRGGGYAGMPLANATLWAVLLAAAGAWWAALPLLAVRMAAGIAVGTLVLEDRRVIPDFYLMPVRDLAGVAVWAAGLFGSTVVWRGDRLKLDREGRIRRAPARAAVHAT